MLQKKQKKMLVLILVAVAIGSFILAGVIMAITGIGGTGNYEVNAEKTIDGTMLRHVRIETVTSDIHLLPSDGTMVKAHFHGTSFTKQVPELSVETNGDELAVQVKDEYRLTLGFGSIYHNTRLDVFLPKTVYESIKALSTSGSIHIDQAQGMKTTVKSVSGSIYIADFIGALRIETTSGSAEIRNTKAETLDFKSVSGSFIGSSIVSDAMSFHTGSGSVHGSSMKAKSISFDSTSGNLKADDISGAMTFKSGSGSLEAEYSTLNGNIEAKSISGSVRLKLPEDAAFALRFKSVSGTIRSNFRYSVDLSQSKKNFEGTVGSSENTISIETTSGSADIMK